MCKRKRTLEPLTSSSNVCGQLCKLIGPQTTEQPSGLKCYLTGVHANAEKINVDKIVVETEAEMQWVLREISTWPKKIILSRVSPERTSKPPPVQPRKH